MTTHAQPRYGQYLTIWAWLMALLVGGTFVSFLPLSKLNIILIILGIASVKAFLVTLFYMHLKHEKMVPLWIVLLFPFFLIGLVVFLLFIGKLIGY